MTVHNHGIDPSCRERLVGACLLQPGVLVLDPYEANPSASRDLVLANLIELLRRDKIALSSGGFADQIEAQTKPPRIPEPGLWGVVEAKPHDGTSTLTWLHTPGDVWYCTIGSRQVRWNELTNPVLVREGVA